MNEEYTPPFTLIDPPYDVMDPDHPWYGKGRPGGIPKTNQSWIELKYKLTGRTKPGGGSYTSAVNISDADADRLIENMQKDMRGYPQFNQTGSFTDFYDSLKKFQDWLVEQYLELPFREQTDKKIQEKQDETRLKELEEKIRAKTSMVPIPDPWGEPTVPPKVQAKTPMVPDKQEVLFDEAGEVKLVPTPTLEVPDLEDYGEERNYIIPESKLKFVLSDEDLSDWVKIFKRFDTLMLNLDAILGGLKKINKGSITHHKNFEKIIQDRHIRTKETILKRGMGDGGKEAEKQKKKQETENWINTIVKAAIGGATLLIASAGASFMGSSYNIEAGNASEKHVAVARLLMSKYGLNEMQAAAIVGTWMQEGFGKGRPDDIEDSYAAQYGDFGPPPIGSSYVGYGWAQWTNMAPGGRLDRVATAIGVTDRAWSDGDNLRAFDWELQNSFPGLIEQLKKETDINKAVETFVRIYEAGGNIQRYYDLHGPDFLNRRIGDAMGVAQKLSSSGQTPNTTPNTNLNTPNTNLGPASPGYGGNNASNVVHSSSNNQTPAPFFGGSVLNPHNMPTIFDPLLDSNSWLNKPINNEVNNIKSFFGESLIRAIEHNSGGFDPNNPPTPLPKAAGSISLPSLFGGEVEYDTGMGHNLSKIFVDTPTVIDMDKVGEPMVVIPMTRPIGLETLDTIFKPAFDEVDMQLDTIQKENMISFERDIDKLMTTKKDIDTISQKTSNGVNDEIVILTQDIFIDN